MEKIEGYISVSEFVDRERNEKRGKLRTNQLRRLALGGYVGSGNKKKFVGAVLKEGIHYKKIGERVFLKEELRIIRGEIFLDGEKVKKKSKQ